MDRADLDSDNNITETVPYDLKGDNRQQGRSVDLGAYESGQAKTQIPIEVLPPEGGAMIITGIPGTFVPGEGEQCTIMAVPQEGWVLVGWSGGRNFGVQLTITITIRIGVPFVIKPIFAPVGRDTDGDGESDDDEIKKGGIHFCPKLEPGLTVSRRATDCLEAIALVRLFLANGFRMDVPLQSRMVLPSWQR